MKPITIEQITTAVAGVYSGDTAQLTVPVTNVVIDNRKAEAGTLFVPIRGERFDGHTFIPAAYEAGAVCCLSEQPTGLPYPYILVQDSLMAFQNLAKFYRDLLPVRVVGITGSAGKTTTKEMIAAVLSRAFCTLKTQGNLNNQTGVPLTVFRMEERHQAAVIEMGTNHFSEIGAVARIVSPEVCVLTNIGTAHIEHLQSREGILQAKCEMLEYMKPGGRVIVHGDDDLLCTLKQERSDVTTFGITPQNDVYAKNITPHGLRGTGFTACWQGREVDIHIPSPGEHMVQNALCAVAVGLAFGMQPQEIVAGIAAYRPVGGRMAITNANGITVLNDTYNANPQSMLSALDVLRQAQGRKVAILGEMYELGENAAQYHKEVGDAARQAADVVLCAGELAQHMQGECTTWYETQDELINDLHRHIHKGDTILVKASRGMQMERTVQALLGDADEAAE